MQDFSGRNLRGRNFKDEDLTGADFSGADIRGAKFTHAKLKGANFTGAKAGLQKRWIILQVVITFVISAILNFVSIFFTALIIAALLTPEGIKQYTIFPGLATLFMLGAVYFAIARQGLTSKAFGTIVVCLAVAVAGAVAVAVAGAVAVAVAVAGAVAVAVAVAVAGLSILLSIYVAWRVSKEDEKFALARSFGIAFSTLGGTKFSRCRSH